MSFEPQFEPQPSRDIIYYLGRLIGQKSFDVFSYEMSSNYTVEECTRRKIRVILYFAFYIGLGWKVRGIF